METAISKGWVGHAPEASILRLGTTTFHNSEIVFQDTDDGGGRALQRADTQAIVLDALDLGSSPKNLLVQLLLKLA